MAGSDVLAAVKALRAAVAEVAACDLSLVTGPELVATLDDLEMVACQLPSVQQRVLARLQTETTPDALGAHSWKELLKVRYRLTGSDANRRLAEAEVLAPRHSLTGDPLAPQLAVTADAQALGVLTAGHVDVIRKSMAKLPGWVDTATGERFEADLVRSALGVDAERLADKARQLLYLLDQDGPVPDDAERARRRALHRGKQGEDGMTEWRAVLTPEAAAVFEALMAKLAAPGMCNPDDPEPCVCGTPSQEQIDNDHRTLAQRQHDALLAIGRIALMGGDLGTLNGLPVTVIIRTTLEQLEARAGLATTGGATKLPVSDVIRMAAHAHHHLAVFDGATGSALAHYRAKRIATPAQRIMLIARDGGCTKPGCTVGAYGCQAHHARRDWAHGGNTNVDDMTLACPPDNRQVDTNDPTAWTTRMTPHHQVEWIPPDGLDTGQPRINTYHHPELLLADLADKPDTAETTDPTPIDDNGDAAAGHDTETDEADQSGENDEDQDVAPSQPVDDGEAEPAQVNADEGDEDDTTRRAYLINTGRPSPEAEAEMQPDDGDEIDAPPPEPSDPDTSAETTVDAAAEPGGPAPPNNDAA